MWVQSLGGKIPWRRAWLPTLVLLPGVSHGQSSLAGYGSLGHKESDITEVTSRTHTYTHTHSVKHYSDVR